MDHEEFRVWGKKIVDYIADYWERLRERTPISDVQPQSFRHFPTLNRHKDPNSGKRYSVFSKKWLLDR